MQLLSNSGSFIDIFSRGQTFCMIYIRNEIVVISVCDRVYLNRGKIYFSTTNKLISNKVIFNALAD